MNWTPTWFKRLQAVLLCIALPALVFSAANARAQTAQANRPFTLIVPFPAGGASDALARQVAPSLSKAMGQTVIVENITGASGTLAAQRMLSAPHDGHHIMVVSSSETIMPPLLMSSVKFQAEDFRLLVDGMSVPLALIARTGLPLNTVEELVAYARNPANKPLSYGSLGNGSIAHLAAEHFEQLTGAKLVHVPYRGGAPLTTDMIGNQIDISFFPFAGGAIQLAETGKVKVLGIASATRLPHLAKYPLLTQAPGLKTYVYSAWNSFAVPRAVPEAMAERLNRELNAILQTPEIKAFAQKMGSFVPEPMNLQQIGAFYAGETERLRGLAKAVKLQAD
jgi:tripartite-type tricarboxylate transporter receptor subunit TctC